MSARESYFYGLLNTRVVDRLLLFSLIVSILISTAASAQISTATSAQTVPSWVGNLLFENSKITADPTLTAPEAQGLGQKFELLFSMVNDQDPLNSDNDVISLTTGSVGSNVIGVAVRNMLPNAKIATLTNQINIKYYFPDRSCDGGSPRIQLYIDPGDSTAPRNAFGYVGHGGFGTGCLTGVWDFVDMTDSVPARWDITQFGGGYQNWAGVVAFFDTRYPNHVVLSGGVYDDSCSFDAFACGHAYYDLLTVENRTLENRQDTVQGPTH
jgi:hypothetical protein